MAALMSGAVLFTSCESWLDVKPSNETAAEQLFSTERGFQEALSGAYTLMTVPELYGREMTFGFVDAIGQQYVLANDQNWPYYYAQHFNYIEGNSISLCESIWKKQFTVIANVNDLLAFVDADPIVFASTLDHDLIKGEALALRAFLHFDLLRLYVPHDADGSSTDKIMPYVDVFSKNTAGSLTFTEIADKIISDLTQAAKLLENDPIRSGVVHPDPYFKNRRFHLNYYAVKALMARVYLYTNHQPEALACALDVIAVQQGQGLFPFVSEADATNSDRSQRDRTFSTEHIFALDIIDLQSYTEGYVYKVNPMLQLQCRRGGYDPDAWGPLPIKKYIFEGYNDYRAEFIERESGIEDISSKFWQSDPKKRFIHKMPLIRIAEMYYIAAECAQSVAYLETVRKARNIDVSLDETLKGEELQAEILKEYNKEFIGEGQVFFYHKRKGSTFINENPVASSVNYWLPMPEQEINFGGRPRPEKMKNEK